MGDFCIKCSSVLQQIQELEAIKKDLSSAADEISQVKQTLRFKVQARNQIDQKLNNLLEESREHLNSVIAMKSGLEKAVMSYRKTERDILGNVNAVYAIGEQQASGKLQTFTDEFLENYGWKEILSGAGYFGTVYDLVSDFRNGKTWRDLIKSGVDTYQFLSGAAKTFNNYKKIGNAVGTKKAMTWWAKNITGLKPLGRASTAKNPLTRFTNNLTNKTSPFNAQFKNVIKNFKGANGAGKAVASWGAVAANGVLNWFDNKDEQENSNGSMSDGRVIAETITETVVDTVLTYGAGIVVGAAVTAALGTVAAPGIVVVAASGAIVAGVNAGVKALTGKTTTEWVSDTILDTGEAIGRGIGEAANKVSEAFGSWFEKYKFA